MAVIPAHSPNTKRAGRPEALSGTVAAIPSGMLLSPIVTTMDTGKPEMTDRPIAMASGTPSNSAPTAIAPPLPEVSPPRRAVTLREAASRSRRRRANAAIPLSPATYSRAPTLKPTTTGHNPPVSTA